MTWTAASFMQRYPEFATMDAALVTSAIAEATAYVDPALAPIDADRGIGLKTADILALSPFGQTARMQSKDGSTTYGKQFAEWARVRAGGPWVAGQSADSSGEWCAQ